MWCRSCLARQLVARDLWTLEIVIMQLVVKPGGCALCTFQRGMKHETSKPDQEIPKICNFKHCIVPMFSTALDALVREVDEDQVGQCVDDLGRVIGCVVILWEIESVRMHTQEKGERRFQYPYIPLHTIGEWKSLGASSQAALEEGTESMVTRRASLRCSKRVTVPDETEGYMVQGQIILSGSCLHLLSARRYCW